jgi:hypothetical protein
MTLNTEHLVSELEQLDAEAAGVAGDPSTPGAAPVPPAPPRDWNAEAADLVQFTRELLVATWDRLEPVWTPDKCVRLSRALAPVMEKYDFSLGRFGPEIMLAAVGLPLGIATLQVIRAPAPGQPAPGAQVPTIDATDPHSLHTRV